MRRTVLAAYRVLSHRSGLVTTTFLLTLLTVVPVGATMIADLGEVHFANSGTPEAQAPFLRGVAALHSFWYEEAGRAFRQAQEIDPDFAMAYWGEAMTHNKPLWWSQNQQAGREVLRRLAPTPEERLAKAHLTTEKGLLATLEILFGEGDKRSRDLNYAEALQRLHKRFPDDHEIATFYALALLGTERRGERDVRARMKAAAVAEEVFAIKPRHPGAPHYLIHAYDDPVHAPLGLRPARIYAEIAPASSHALHMPSHIFVQLGMWDEAAAANERAWTVSVDWVERENLTLVHRDHHSLDWLQYAYLQQGRYREAETLLSWVELPAEETTAARIRGRLVRMQARYVIETGRWQKEDFAIKAKQPYSRHARAGELLAGGSSAARMGNLAVAEEAERQLAALKEFYQSEEEPYRARQMAVMEQEVAALIQLEQGLSQEALRLAETAATLEGELDPPSGPPYPIKPARELYGEVLLELNRPVEALRQFELALQLMPNRAAALLGAARAAAGLGNEAIATVYYRRFLDIWHRADRELAPLTEARRFLQNTAVSQTTGQ